MTYNPTKYESYPASGYRGEAVTSTGLTDGQTDGRTDGSKTLYPSQLRCVGYNYIPSNDMILSVDRPVGVLQHLVCCMQRGDDGDQPSDPLGVGTSFREDLGMVWSP
jgi:hypothetical protein